MAGTFARAYLIQGVQGVGIVRQHSPLGPQRAIRTCLMSCEVQMLDQRLEEGGLPVQRRSRIFNANDQVPLDAIQCETSHVVVELVCRGHTLPVDPAEFTEAVGLKIRAQRLWTLHYFTIRQLNRDSSSTAACAARWSNEHPCKVW